MSSVPHPQTAVAMRDSKSAFCPVVVKQEPRDPSDDVSPTSAITITTTSSPPPATTNHNARQHLTPSADTLSLAHHPHHRPGTGTTGGGVTPRGGGAASSDVVGGYRSSQDFVAEIARRVREESNSALRSLDLTPVTALGPLVNADLNLAGLGAALYSSSALVVAPAPAHAPPPLTEGRSGKSRGEYACGECSSRFDTARDFRAHCLTHQVLMAESKLRRSRGEGGGGTGEDGDEDIGMCVFGGGGGGGARGAGLVMEGGAGFTCEDCDMRFSSRDTYAMHMLIRAKNEACFPHRTNTTTNTTTTPSTTSSSSSAATTAVTAANNNNSSADNANNDSNSSLCSASSLTNSSHLPLIPSSALLLAAANTPAQLKREPVSRGDVGGGGAGGVGGRSHSLADPAHQLMSSLGVDVGRLADYGPSWWSKYMPWMAAGAGLLGGASAGESGAGDGPMVCYMCGELFSNRDSLAMHVLFHTRDTPTSSAKGASPGPRWRKPIPTLSTLPPSSGSASSSAMLLMGQAAMGQLQHQSHLSPFNLSHGIPSSSSYGHELSPSEAEAVASAAAAAAVAAVTTTPPRQATPTGHVFPSRPQHNGLTGSIKQGTGRAGETLSPRDTKAADKAENKALNWAATTTEGSTPVESGSASRLVLPQRGASAPITGSAHFSQTSPFSCSASDTCNVPRDRSRPLSADHVGLRYNHKPLLADVAADAHHHIHRPHSDDVSAFAAAAAAAAQWKGLKDSSSAAAVSNGNVLWNNGADSAHLQHSSAFNVFRLQRLKKLRLAKGVYRRPGARGRPPMTIYGTSPRRHAGGHTSHQLQQQNHTGSRSPVETASNLLPSPASLEDSSPSSSAPTSSSCQISSMVKLLASQGHEVSACVHCQLLFGDRTLYQLHMGLHNVNNPWQCNACGLACSSRLHFATHTLHY